MYVCLCRGVSERKVRHAIALGARTVEQIADSCGAGSRCGGCWPMLDDMLRAAGHDPSDVLAAATSTRSGHHAA